MEQIYSLNYKKLLKWGIVVLVIGALFIAYKLFDPAKTNYFPKCPFKVVTGLDCPGCGSQRAIHSLLNFELLAALKANMLLVLSIPYVIMRLVIDFTPKPSPILLRWRKRLFGVKAIWIVFTMVIIFWIGRNIVS